MYMLYSKIKNLNAISMLKFTKIQFFPYIGFEWSIYTCVQVTIEE